MHNPNKIEVSDCSEEKKLFKNESKVRSRERGLSSLLKGSIKKSEIKVYKRRPQLMISVYDIVRFRKKRFFKIGPIPLKCEVSCFK